MTRVAVFIGTRPEAIKMAPVVRALVDDAKLEPFVVSTGQHREMLQQVVDLFDIPVHESLDVMRPNQSLAGLTSRLMASIDDVLERVEPALSLVQGDTTTVLSAGLASFYRRIPVGHVEAGLRTGDLTAPFPEEANRVLVSRITSLHFPPTPKSAQNLLAEGVPEQSVLVTGNTVIDALQMEVRRQASDAAKASIDAGLGEALGETWRARPFVLITGHRRENFGSGFEQMCRAIRTLATRFPDTDFVYPVHLNPNVQEPVRAHLSGLANVRLIEPQPYDRFVALLAGCRFVLTDSGGVQEEAPGLGKPVLVMRATTERPEGIDAGTVRLVGAEEESIVREVTELMVNEAVYRSMSEAKNPYGDGHAAGRIVSACRDFLGG